MVMGVNFTRESGERISDAVKKVEAMPDPTNTQRRRAGGLGRMTLWEVTAVQETPKTVTVKRVLNQDGILIDASLKSGVLYDPDTKPSIGERGLIIRLGEGSLFFFRREAARRIFITEHSHTLASSPDATFGFPTIARSQKIEGSGQVSAGFFKFANVIPEVGDALYYFVSLGIIDLVAWTSVKGAKIENGSVTFRAIQEDFDASQVTWNNQDNLDMSSGFFDFDLCSVNSDEISSNITGHGSERMMFGRTAKTQGHLDIWFAGNVYGLRMDVSFDATTEDGTQVQLDIRRLVGFDFNFRSFLEWKRP